MTIEALFLNGLYRDELDLMIAAARREKEGEILAFNPTPLGQLRNSGMICRRFVARWHFTHPRARIFQRYPIAQRSWTGETKPS